MVTLEQVKLLETKVVQVIDFVNRVTEENTCLKDKLGDYQKRIDELEGLVQHFKDEQSRIEDGILNALDRLNQFEAAVENSLSPIKAGAQKDSAGEEAPKAAVPPEEAPYKTESAETGNAPGGPEEKYAPVEDDGEEADEDILFGSGGNGEAGAAEDKEPAQADEPAPSELDIF
jgi:TolA-binding protein